MGRSISLSNTYYTLGYSRNMPNPVAKNKKISPRPKSGVGMASAFVNHYFQNSQQPPLLIDRESLQLPGDKAALLARRHIQDVGEKLVGITLQRIGYGNEGVQFRRFESALDITDIAERSLSKQWLSQYGWSSYTKVWARLNRPSSNNSSRISG